MGRPSCSPPPRPPSAAGPRPTPSCSRPQPPRADLAALWSVPQAPGRRDGHVVLRRLDGKGRLMLPLTLPHQTRTAAPAGRAGAVLTVYLPGSPAEPAASRVVAALPLDARGRSRSPGPPGPSSAGSPARTC
jgi:hypothetical protein